jgi:hypothetical protein
VRRKRKLEKVDIYYKNGDFGATLDNGYISICAFGFRTEEEASEWQNWLFCQGRAARPAEEAVAGKP